MLNQILGTIIFGLASFAYGCHPGINVFEKQYIIGYGSLLLEQSKAQTIGKSAQNIPVNVMGYERAWMVRGDIKSQPTTFLGVKPSHAHFFNGVIFKLNNVHQLKNIDKREQWYCREKVNRKSIKMLINRPLPGGEYWIYVPHQRAIGRVSVKYPISDYYLNLFIGGCLQITNKYQLKDYGKHCVSTTLGWRPYMQYKKPPKLPDFGLNQKDLDQFKKTYISH